MYIGEFVEMPNGDCLQILEVVSPIRLYNFAGRGVATFSARLNDDSVQQVAVIKKTQTK